MISLVFVIFAAMANSIMDTLKFRFTRSVFNRPGTKLYNFSEPLSWKRKWKNKDSSQGEAFLFSSTILVFITDLWHLAQMAMITAFFIAIVVYDPMAQWGLSFNLFGITMDLVPDRLTDLIIYKTIYSVIFETFFSKILITWKK